LPRSGVELVPLGLSTGGGDKGSDYGGYRS